MHDIGSILPESRQDNGETGDIEAKAKCRRDSGRCVGATAPESGYGQVPVIIVKDVMETKMSAGKANSLDKMLECVVTDVAERDSERAAIYAATDMRQCEEGGQPETVVELDDNQEGHCGEPLATAHRAQS
ncbi:hypothetical protein F444_08997 [Phytophthora nicotianae P1976]|uniref:Uncharacterized protein n=1 Tax=Phytophthora nicotianae P1976 TaxID=1317066 RepID=A0A081A946_PHYNI|nr:hypothetical protein F444_08997 [Phytophthora nicotianae P1976]